MTRNQSLIKWTIEQTSKVEDLKASIGQLKVDQKMTGNSWAKTKELISYPK